MSETSKTHTCDACGGTGCPDSIEHSASCVEPCEVCNGAGRISDVMPVSDSIADAETLGAYLSIRARIELAQNYMTFGGPMPECNRSDDFAHAAVRFVPEHYGLGYAVDANGKAATYCAKLAFRVVPELRA